MPALDRRRVLQGLGALVVAPALSPRPALERGGPGGGAFASGVASFDPTADGVLLWTRVTSLEPRVTLRWTVAEDEGLTRIVRTGTARAEAEADHCVTVPVDGLPPGRTWWYGFEAPGGQRSPVGRTRTMPAGPAERVRLGLVSCSRYAAGGFAAYRALAEREVDLVVHLGDYIYEDGRADARAHDPPEELRTLEQYRRRYAQHRLDPDLQALHARHPMVSVWDDHELADNAWSGGARAHDDAIDGPWPDRRQAATTAHEEWVPGRTRRREDGRLEAWRALALATDVELLVIDTRSWRDEVPRDAAAVEASEDRTILGEAQRAWLLDRLARPERPAWTLVANQVMYHPLRVPLPGGVLASQVEEAGFLVVGDEAVNPDQWDGYAAEREAVSTAMGGRGGVVVLTGDVHSSWAWEGPANDGGQPAMVEVVAPSVTAESLGDRLPAPAALVETALRGLDAELSHVDLSQHGYAVVELGPDDLQAEWWYVEVDDPASQTFGAARRAPRSVPMRLTEVDGPRPDPVPTTAPPSTTTTAPVAPRRDDGFELPWPLAGGAAAVAATVAAAVALRRRR